MTRLVVMLAASLLSDNLAADTSAAGAAPDRGAELALRIGALTPQTPWVESAPLNLKFDAHHPQGLVKVGETFFLSSVQVVRRPKALPAPEDGFDRDPGQGVGHLFRFNRDGRLTGELQLGEGTIYHPGGIDSDGEFLWVPVAEYRPLGRSKIYRIHMDSLRATEVFSFGDHIGAVAFDSVSRVLHGVSWGSRHFYSWRIPESGPVTDASIDPLLLRRRNTSYHIDYQDCHWIGHGKVICSGLRSRTGQQGSGAVDAVGGIELVEAAIPRPLFQLPVDRKSPSGRLLTQNAFWVEPAPSGLRFWFIPDDGRATVRIFDVPVRPQQLGTVPVGGVPGP
jgi:hypothetical protein